MTLEEEVAAYFEACSRWAERYKAMTDERDTALAKLAKAREALKQIADPKNEYGINARLVASAILAELEEPQ